jgi:outer membrane protein assembly factor BamB
MTNWIEREAMQQFHPDSAPDRGNSDEQPLVIEDLPVEAAQHQTTTTRKSKWQRNLPSLIAAGILLLVAVIAGVRLLPPAPAGQPSPGTSPSTAPLSTTPATPIVNGGPGAPDHSVYPTIVDGVIYLSTEAGVTSALTGSTGTLLWRSTTQGAASVPPVVAHGIVYVTTHLSETASSIYVLQASDGSTLWNYTTKGRDAPYL